MKKFIGLDFETHLIGQGNLTPAIVCGALSASAVREDTKVLVRGSRLKALVREALREHHVIGQNIAYDLSVAMALWPSLTEDIFKAYDDRRIGDTMIREGLWNLSVVGEIGQHEKRDALPGLGWLANKYLGMELQKDGGWRLHYHELDGIPFEDWPADAVDYVKTDAWAAREVFRKQEDSPVEWLHVQSHFALTLMTQHGLEIDQELKAKLHAKVLKELSKDNLPLIFEHGLVREAVPPMPHKGGHKNHEPSCVRKLPCPCPVKMCAPQEESVAKAEVLIPRIMQVCTENNIEIPYTPKSKTFPTGQVKTDEETIAMLSGLDPVLKQFHTRQESAKLRDSYFPAMDWPFGSGRPAARIHPGYDPLKKTGRISSRGTTKKNQAKASYASVNIQQADPRVRAIYVPGKGNVFAVADFSAVDLCCLAQTVFRLFGDRVLLDQINAGVDPHAWLAAAVAYQLSPQFARRVRGKSDEEGYQEFCSLATGTEKEQAFYEEYRSLAKKVGLAFPGGMGINTFIALVARELHQILPARTAKLLKKIWLRTYPGMKRYLAWVQEQKDGDMEGPFNLTYTSPLGMRRTRCSYTECANGNALQTPAAEGMKLAMWAVTRACYLESLGDVLYGCRPVINMHDELVLLVPAPCRDPQPAHNARCYVGLHGYQDCCDGGGTTWASIRARRLQALLIEGMNVVLPDVKVRAKPILTTRWVKKAKQVLNDRDEIVPWEWVEDA